MNIWQLRFGILLLLIWAVIIHKNIIPPYLIGLMAVLEFLNQRKEFKYNTNYRIMNLMSFVFIFIIFLNRIRTIHYNLEIEVPVNILEHLMFSLFFCVALWELLKMKFIKPMKLNTRLILINLLIFVIGTGNEIYQYLAYSISTSDIHFFMLDAFKDIVVNNAGSLLFTALVIVANKPGLSAVRQFVIEGVEGI